MKKSPIAIAFVVFVFLVCLSANGLAEKKAGTFSLTPSIGGYVFEGNEDLHNTPLFGLGIGYDITPKSGVEFVFNYADSESDITDKDVDAYLFRLNYIYNFLVTRKFVPFISAGGGLISLDREKGKNSTDPLFCYGGGLKYFFNDSWALRADVQHIVTFDDHYNNLAYTLGISYLFGGKKSSPPPPKDSDGDGVVDSLDQCPGTPAGAPVDATGCPLDSDKDGVPDYLDKCPNTPSGVTVDSHGCPLDTDGDGVYDYLDKCPGTPSGVKVDSRGCPLDTDGDGVYDYLDKCPGTPKKAPVDARGCWVIKGVHFDTGKADLHPLSQNILNSITTVLAANPHLKLEIGGHTDSTGSAAFNKKLSQRRAKAVMDYLIKHGVDASRLSAHGYGSSMPAASNSTAAGRAKNRRVELKPI